MKGQLLERAGEVDYLNGHIDLQRRGREIEDAADASFDEPDCNVLGHVGGNRKHREFYLFAVNYFYKIRERFDGHASDRCAAQLLVVIEGDNHSEPAASKPRITHQGSTDFASPDDGKPPRAIE